MSLVETDGVDSYVWLLTPDIPPFNRKYKDREHPFYGINDRIPLLLTILLGLQHALAMIGGGEYFLILRFPPNSIVLEYHG